MPARLRDRCRVGAPIVNTQTDDRFRPPPADDERDAPPFGGGCGAWLLLRCARDRAGDHVEAAIKHQGTAGGDCHVAATRGTFADVT
jgi:hypothetical protein